MFDKFDVYIGDELINNPKDLIDKIVINKRGERHVIQELLNEKADYCIVKLRDCNNDVHLKEDYFMNVKIIENISKQFKNFINQMEIKVLLHFTNVKNLSCIFENGLITRDNLSKLNCDTFINDIERYDKTNGISLSVSFPNYKMFYCVRKDNPNEDYCVIVLDPSILYELDCGFFYTNAANRIFKEREDIIYKKINSFKDMFADKYPPERFFGFTHLRETMSLPKSFTTDPQAEILVFEKIPLKYILGVVFENKEVMETYKKVSRKTKTIVEKSMFKYREDYECW